MSRARTRQQPAVLARLADAAERIADALEELARIERVREQRRWARAMARREQTRHGGPPPLRLVDRGSA